MSAPPIDVAGLLPHGPAARFVQKIVSLDSGTIVARGTVPINGAYAETGLAPAAIAVELAAQSAGILEALSQDHPPGVPARVGYVVGFRELLLHRAEIPAGRDLIARVTLDGVARPLTTYRVEVTLDEQEVLSGEIRIFTVPATGT